MTVANAQVNSNIKVERSLKKDYSWFYSNLYANLQKATEEFFQKSLDMRFLGISSDENILFYGDEYFVNKISLAKDVDFKMKISSGVIEYLLDSTLGPKREKFELSKLSDIEAMLIKSFTVFVFKNLEDKFDKSEKSKKQAKNSQNLDFTFFVKKEDKHLGKIIISFPICALGEFEYEKIVETFSLADFKKTQVRLNLCVGKSKIALNDIKAIEDGDIMVLENSDIHKMAVVLDGKEYVFKINPNPSLIISIDNDGGDEMEEDTSVKPQNMWDSILVDVVAEFDNVKLTLGELKQISEGLVIDVGSVYSNKIKLRVENQVVASGELVILNDRYGVRIDEVNKTKEQPKVKEQAQVQAPEQEADLEDVQAEAPAQRRPVPPRPAARAGARPVPPRAGARPVPPRPGARPVPPRPGARPAPQAQAQAPQAAEGNENFDYSDFEIEDESI